MPERIHVNLMLGRSGADWLDAIAAKGSQTSDARITRSAVIRAALTVARRHEAEVLAILEKQL